jgi:FkbH-like protein
MSASSTIGLLISDFNVENLSAYLNNDPGKPETKSTAAPYGQVMQTLLDATLPCWTPSPDFLVVWTRPEGVLKSFGQLLQGIPVEEDRILAEVDDYSRTIALAAERSKTAFVPLWTVPTMHHGLGLQDLTKGVGISRSVMQANLRLLQNLESVSNVIPLNASRWVELVGENAFNERLWYSGKIQFANSVFKIAAREIKAALRGVRGMARKLVVLDLDDTLWGGIVGDAGWENVVLGGLNPMGEAFVDFQRSLKALKNQGVLLAIASKNEEAVALQAIKEHPEMILREGDFAGWRINWNDKAQNIADIARELNLGLDSVVFIDDSQVERDRVRQALPDVLVPEWPSDARLYMRTLHSLDCFQKPVVTDEDRRRGEMYSQERQRTDSKSRAVSVEEWLNSLEMTVRVEPLSSSNLSRAAQLLNKTNQMNLSTRRMTDQEFMAWSEQHGHRVWVFNVSDRFGDSGLTGILSLEVDHKRARIADFILSCRVMGRKVEETMLHWAVEWAVSLGLAQVVAVYSPTPKNAPCRAFLQNSGLRHEGNDCFTCDTSIGYPLPKAIRLNPPLVNECFAESVKPAAIEV